MATQELKATQEQKDMLMGLLKPILEECGVTSFKLGKVDVMHSYEICLRTDEFESALPPLELRPVIFFNDPPLAKKVSAPEKILLQGEETFARESHSASKGEADEKVIITFDEHLQRLSGLQDSESKSKLEATLKKHVTDALRNYETHKENSSMREEKLGKKYMISY